MLEPSRPKFHSAPIHRRPLATIPHLAPDRLAAVPLATSPTQVNAQDVSRRATGCRVLDHEVAPVAAAVVTFVGRALPWDSSSRPDVVATTTDAAVRLKAALPGRQTQVQLVAKNGMVLRTMRILDGNVGTIRATRIGQQGSEFPHGRPEHVPTPTKIKPKNHLG